MESKKTSGIRFSGVVIGSLAIVALVWSSNSLIRAIWPSPTHQQASLRENVFQLDQLLNNSDPEKNPITAETLKGFMDKHSIAIYPPIDFPQIKTKPAATQDNLLRPRVIQAKIERLEQRVGALEKSPIPDWVAAIFAAVTWLLTTFLKPWITHLGKRTFAIKDKD